MSKFIFTFSLFMILWVGLTSSTNFQELIAGVILSLVVASFAFRTFTDEGLAFFKPKKLFYIIKYLLVFIKALIVANLDVARRVISPRLPINPGIVIYETRLKNDTAKVILANSITLTPGTLTVDIIDNKLFIHWIDVKSTESKTIYREIGEAFEKILREIFE